MSVICAPGYVKVQVTVNNKRTSDITRGNQIVAVDPRYFRPTEVETLLGDATKAKRVLGWQARTPFSQLVAEMVAADLQTAKRDALVKDAGYKTYDFHE